MESCRINCQSRGLRFPRSLRSMQAAVLSVVQLLPFLLPNSATRDATECDDRLLRAFY
jgi:hypothetical protein